MGVPGLLFIWKGPLDPDCSVDSNGVAPLHLLKENNAGA